MIKLANTDCQRCEGSTTQKIHFCKTKIVKDEDIENDGLFKSKTKYEYMVIQCTSCNTISFLERVTFVEPNEFGQPPMIIESHYPDYSDTGYNFLNEEELHCLPKTLATLYDEVVSVFKSNSEILSGIGLRMLVEAICIEQKVEGSNLQKKIVSLREKGLISANEVPILDKLRLIGNVAAHEIKGMSLNVLSYALDIINHVLKSIYILPKINRKIKIR